MGGIVGLILLYFVCILGCKGQTAAAPGSIAFDLSTFSPDDRATHVFQKFTNLTDGLTIIEVKGVPDSVGFYVVQVHAYGGNVSLSGTLEFETQTFINGTNVGLVGLNKTDALFFVFNNGNGTRRVLMTVVVYESDAPIPGGCNLTFDTEIAPYQLLAHTDEVIIVQSQPPSPYTIGTETCENNTLKVDLYHLYLHEYYYNVDAYFSGLQNMLTVDGIRSNGYKVNTVDGHFKYRKLYSAYRGVGHVFAIVTTDMQTRKSSAYVPAISYGCDLNNQPETCVEPITTFWKFVCAFLLIVGVFVCFTGHYFFRITMFIMGTVVGVFITDVVLSFGIVSSFEARSTTALSVGLIYGLAWLFIWWKFGVPVLSVSLTYTCAAFIFSSIIFYAGVADLTAFNSDINFWFTYLGIILLSILIFNMCLAYGHIFACTFIGSYACVAALNFYTGGNLQYIIINAYRRIVVKDFNMATIDPPFELLDGFQILLWSGLVLFGFYYQCRWQKGRSPFPPSGGVREGFGETTRLLGESSSSYSSI